MSHYNQLPRLHETDALTDLPNLAAISRHLDILTAQMPGNFGLLMLDVDGFKGVNDEHGHHWGDRLLAVIGQTLNDNLRRDDRFMPARKSGDEFLITLREVHDDTHIVAVGERIRHLLMEQIQHVDNRAGISIGGRIHRIGETPADLMQAVDKLMFLDKDRRKIERYDDSQARSAIQKIAQLALSAGIDDRDIPRLLSLHRRGLY